MLHIHFFLTSTLWMIKFITLTILTFYCCSTSILFANKAFSFESFLLDVLNSFYINDPILLLEIALWNPYGTDIMNPNIMANRNLRRIAWFYKIIIVTFLLFLTFLSNYSYYLLLLWNLVLLTWNILLLLLTIGTFFRVLIISRICLLKNVRVYMNGCSFHSTALYIAQGTREVYSCRSKS